MSKDLYYDSYKESAIIFDKILVTLSSSLIGLSVFNSKSFVYEATFLLGLIMIMFTLLLILISYIFSINACKLALKMKENEKSYNKFEGKFDLYSKLIEVFRLLCLFLFFTGLAFILISKFF